MLIHAFPTSSQALSRLSKHKKREEIEAAVSLDDAIMAAFAEDLVRVAEAAHEDVFICQHPELDPSIRNRQFPFGPTSIVGKCDRYFAAIRNIRFLVRSELTSHCKRNKIQDPYNNSIVEYQVANRHFYSSHARKAIDAIEYAARLWRQHCSSDYIPLGA